MSEDNKTFIVKYYSNYKDEGKQFSHEYTECWKKTDLYCPHCGKKTVWVRDDGGGDYYVGEQYICIGCKVVFYLPNGTMDCNDEQDKQRLEQLIC